MEYDLHNSIRQVVALELATAAGVSSVGEVIDTQGFESLSYIVTSGVIATGDFTVLLEESEDDGTGIPTTWATVSTELVLGDPLAFATDADQVSKRVGSIGKARFQRMTLLGNDTPAGQFSAVAILSHPQSRPTAA